MDSSKLNYFLESTICYCLQGRINHLLIICLFDAKKSDYMGCWATEKN